MRGWGFADVTRSVEFGRADAPPRSARRQSGPSVSVPGPFAFALASGGVDPAQRRRARGRHSHRLRSHCRLHITRLRILTGARSFTVIEGNDRHLRIAALHRVGLARLKSPPLSEIQSEMLPGPRFHGANFGRQVPLDRFVVDFHCDAAKLVVDPRTADPGDGRQHQWFADYDKGRSEVPESRGIRIIPFTNDEIRDDLDLVLARINAALRLPFD